MDVTYLRIWIEARSHAVRARARSEGGAGLVEYVLLMGLLILAVTGAIIFLSGRMGSTLSRTGSSVP